MATPLQENGTIRTSILRPPPHHGGLGDPSLLSTHYFCFFFTKIVHCSRLMSHARSDAPFTHILDQTPNTCPQRRIHTVSKGSLDACMDIHTVHAQYRYKYTLTHTCGKAAHTFAQQSVTQSDKQDQSPTDFLSEFVNRFQGSVIYFLSVCRGFTIN